MKEVNGIKLANSPLKFRNRRAWNDFFIRKYCKWVTFGRFSRAVSMALDIGTERGQFDCHKALEEANPKLYKQLIVAAIKKEKKRLKAEEKAKQPLVVSDKPKSKKK